MAKPILYHDISNRSLTTMPTLPKTPTIIALKADQNNFSSLNNLPKDLKFLQCQKNKIAFLSNISSISNSLELLDLSENRLISLEGISQLKVLQELRIRHNYIGDDQVFHLEAMKQLKVLDISHNHLRGGTVFDILSSLPYLETLENSNNDFVNICIKYEYPQLKRLILDTNKTRTITFHTDMPKLVHLSLKENNLSELHGFFSLRLLTELYMDGNDFISISEELNELSKLKILSLSHNAIYRTLELNLPNLETIDISHNQLAELGFLQKCLRLRSIDASNNCLRQLQLGRKAFLLYLIIENNQITDISEIRSFKKLHTLNARQNSLEHALRVVEILEELPNIRCLTLNENRMGKGIDNMILARFQHTLQEYNSVQLNQIQIHSSDIIDNSDSIQDSNFHLSSLNVSKITKPDFDISYILYDRANQSNAEFTKAVQLSVCSGEYSYVAPGLDISQESSINISPQYELPMQMKSEQLFSTFAKPQTKQSIESMSNFVKAANQQTILIPPLPLQRPPLNSNNSSAPLSDTISHIQRDLYSITGRFSTEENVLTDTTNRACSCNTPLQKSVNLQTTQGLLQAEPKQYREAATNPPTPRVDIQVVKSVATSPKRRRSHAQHYNQMMKVPSMSSNNSENYILDYIPSLTSYDYDNYPNIARYNMNLTNTRSVQRDSMSIDIDYAELLQFACTPPRPILQVETYAPITGEISNSGKEFNIINRIFARFYKRVHKVIKSYTYDLQKDFSMFAEDMRDVAIGYYSGSSSHIYIICGHPKGFGAIYKEKASKIPIAGNLKQAESQGYKNRVLVCLLALGNTEVVRSDSSKPTQYKRWDSIYFEDDEVYIFNDYRRILPVYLIEYSQLP